MAYRGTPWIKRALTAEVQMDEHNGARDGALLALVDLGLDVPELVRLQARHIRWAGEGEAQHLAAIWHHGNRVHKVRIPTPHDSWVRSYLITAHLWDQPEPLFPRRDTGRPLTEGRLRQILRAYRRQVLGPAADDEETSQPQEATG